MRTQYSAQNLMINLKIKRCGMTLRTALYMKIDDAELLFQNERRNASPGGAGVQQYELRRL